MRKISQSDIFVYSCILVLVLGIFYLQTQSSISSGPLFVILFMLLFYAVWELFSLLAGTFTASVAIVLQIYQAIKSGDVQGATYLTNAILISVITGFYFLIKRLRQKRLEKTLEYVAHLKSLINLSLQPIILKNERGQIIFISESIKELLSLQNNIPSGATLDGYIFPDDVQEHKTFLNDVLKNPGERKTVELRFKKGETGYIWTKLDSINLLKHNDIRAIVSSVQDITFQKELDREKVDIIKQEKKARSLAEKAVKDRDEFLSIASHELKTPLTTILLQLQATLRKISSQTLADFSGSDLLKSLQIAEKQSQNLSVLIKDLLNVSLTSTHKLTLSKEKVDLTKLVSDLIHKYEVEIKLSGCTVVAKISDSEIIGSWDAVRIEQALTNLFMNALRHAPHSRVIISVYRHNDFAVFRIKDSGQGIPKEFHDKIFAPFNRINNNSNNKGLGVGLFIAKQIINAHDGDITLTSKIGKGSSFTVSLPLSTQK
ncbi:MAG TPA: PAS domain-containing sensor histidine kinase [Patescibacteria group bacterium]|nr:PAS domain-containing sensor histidine kinase [Patescibacteria group bacterium]